MRSQIRELLSVKWKVDCERWTERIWKKAAQPILQYYRIFPEEMKEMIKKLKTQSQSG
jgi:hypothetical protein